MRFSVLVPVYNVEQYLEKCIDSILNQTYQDFELILVDDGSTDGSGEICDRYRTIYSSKIKVLHKRNQGVLAARISGIEMANSDFCVFVDSDDYVEGDLLAVIYDYLNNDFEIDMLLYSFTYYKNGKKGSRYKKIAKDAYIWAGEDKKEIYEKISCSSDITSIWTKAIRTSILKEDPTDYTLYYGKNMAEDLLQSLYPLTAARKIMYTDKALYNYRINDESISRSFDVETLTKKNTIHVYEKVLEYLISWDMDTNEMREKVNAKWFNEVMYIISKSYEAASTKEEQNLVLRMDWNCMIPPNTYDVENIYENEDYKKLYSMWNEKKIRGIQRYFIIKKYYQKLKGTKRRWIKSC